MLTNTISKAKTKISQCLDIITEFIPPDQMREFISTSLDSYLKETQRKNIKEKCIEFYIYKKICLNQLSRAFLPSDIQEKIEYQKSLGAYINMTFSYLFFNDFDDKTAIASRIDNDTYFCLLSYALNVIQFPSLVSEQIISSVNLNRRHKIPLSRRNFLAATMFSSDIFTDIVLFNISKTNQNPSQQQFKKTCKKNMMHLDKSIGNNFAYSMKHLEKTKIGDYYRVFRGYEIEDSQDIIVNRKIRKQDANKSFSFSTNKSVALNFANYRLDANKIPDTVLSYDDRIFLARTMFSNNLDFIAKQSRKKCILSEYEIHESDIILTPIFSENDECEVFALPQNATLTRYSIVNSFDSVIN